MLTILAPKRGSKYPLSFQRLGELPLPAYIELDLEDRVVTFTCWDFNTGADVRHAWTLPPVENRPFDQSDHSDQARERA